MSLTLSSRPHSPHLHNSTAAASSGVDCSTSTDRQSGKKSVCQEFMLRKMHVWNILDCLLAQQILVQETALFHTLVNYMLKIDALHAQPLQCPLRFLSAFPVASTSQSCMERLQSFPDREAEMQETSELVQTGAFDPVLYTMLTLRSKQNAVFGSITWSLNTSLFVCFRWIITMHERINCPLHFSPIRIVIFF